MYTIKDIQKLGLCKGYTEERLKELGEGRESLSRREILKLDIDIDDKNWIVPRLVSTEVVVTWAQYCADTAEKHTGNAAYAARSARSAGYAHAAAANTRYAADAAEYAGYAADHATDAAEYAARSAAAKSAATAARYAVAVEYAARSAALSAAAARATADAADADVSYASAYASYAWGKTHKTELYRLLSHLCDMAEE